MREQTEDDLSKEAPLPSPVKDNALRRIRVVLDLMKPHSDKWVEYLRRIAIDKREPGGLYQTKELLNSLLKIVGGKIGYSGIFDRTYWFCEVFVINDALLINGEAFFINGEAFFCEAFL